MKDRGLSYKRIQLIAVPKILTHLTFLIVLTVLTILAVLIVLTVLIVLAVLVVLAVLIVLAILIVLAVLVVLAVLIILTVLAVLAAVFVLLIFKIILMPEGDLMKYHTETIDIRRKSISKQYIYQYLKRLRYLGINLSFFKFPYRLEDIK